MTSCMSFLVLFLKSLYINRELWASFSLQMKRCRQHPQHLRYSMWQVKIELYSQSLTWKMQTEIGCIPHSREPKPAVQNGKWSVGRKKKSISPKKHTFISGGRKDNSWSTVVGLASSLAPHSAWLYEAASSKLCKPCSNVASDSLCLNTVCYSERCTHLPFLPPFSNVMVTQASFLQS